MSKIYVASSWRNREYPEVLLAIRNAGYECYDFRNPEPGNNGFSFSRVDPDWLNWSPQECVRQLETHPDCQKGFALDKAALDWCDTLVMAQPCGNSAHLELGYAAGQGKRTIVLMREERFEPDLMILVADRRVTSIPELLAALADLTQRAA